ncbi:hypothetical protein KQX54_004603 [Cotesia glomerata]|uniref:Uncharacterized protein n=1 Tax=Cotesia glomerata TaxID=32391 RepID=A0AAV7HYA2_COTGL|nr:hypothetical protein KQX54_004603 [Cotesia glomerata]
MKTLRLYHHDHYLSLSIRMGTNITRFDASIPIPIRQLPFSKLLDHAPDRFNPHNIPVEQVGVLRLQSCIVLCYVLHNTNFELVMMPMITGMALKIRISA